MLSIADIQQLLIDQKYQDYAVTDATSFYWLLPGKVPFKDLPISGDHLTDENRKQIIIDNLTNKSKAIYDKAIDFIKNYRGDPRSAEFIPGQKAGFFLAVHTYMDNNPIKKSECSNFAFHAIGLLLKKNVAEHYNICLAGVMGGRHNIAILVPKNVKISAAEKFAGNLPEGSLIVDPWAVGMGNEVDHALVVAAENFAYKDSLAEMVIHYESDTDLEIAEAFTKHKRVELPKLLKQLNKQLLQEVQFDDNLNLLRKLEKDLKNRGYESASLVAKKLVEDLAAEQKQFEDGKMPKNQFAKRCNALVEAAKVSELYYYRGVSKLFFELTRLIIRLVTFGQLNITPASVTKIKQLEQPLKKVQDAPRDPENDVEEVPDNLPGLT